jgi:hypothetical protein
MRDLHAYALSRLAFIAISLRISTNSLKFIASPTHDGSLRARPREASTKVAPNLSITSRRSITCEADRHVKRDTSTHAYVSVIIISLAVSISTNLGARFDVASGCAESNGRLIFPIFYLSSRTHPRARNRLCNSTPLRSRAWRLQSKLELRQIRTHTGSDRYLQSA